MEPQNDPSDDTQVRFLWGIMTTLRPKDAIRRQVIRRTYLSYYQDYYEQNNDNNNNNNDKICSLRQAKDKPSCQIVYTFVVGANPHAPMDLVDNSHNTTSYPLILDAPLSEHLHPTDPQQQQQQQQYYYEDDMTYLNLQENMEDGKTPSWFHYANTLVQEYHIDYIAKVDSDTILFPDQFLEFVKTTLPPRGRRIYGGIPYDVLTCGGYRRQYCPDMVGKTYMSGELYFLSADLSRFITSPQLNRTAVRIPKEDMCTGNFVHSHPQPLLEAVVSRHQALWEHGDHIKEPHHYEQRWNQVVMKKTNIKYAALSSKGFRIRLGK